MQPVPAIRNRRYQTMQKLLDEGKYFSDSEMQSRNPYLFEQMVGQYMTDAEKEQLRRESYANNYGRVNFSSYLLETMRQAQMKSDSNAEMERLKETRPVPSTVTDEEKQLLRQEFLDQMKQDFLNGKDADHYDYRQTDDSQEFDEQFDRDQEDKYFDSSD